MFPSPIGELHFSILLRQAIDEALNEFPSPIGELHFSMLDISPVQYPEPQVSVPYRGATFLNTPSFFVITPLKARFPSPIGELHFSILKWVVLAVVAVGVSVPYRGATFLNILFHFSCNPRKGFRPLSGSYISQFSGRFACSNLCMRFRPLSGSYISQYGKNIR